MKKSVVFISLSAAVFFGVIQTANAAYCGGSVGSGQVACNIFPTPLTPDYPVQGNITCEMVNTSTGYESLTYPQAQYSIAIYGLNNSQLQKISLAVGSGAGNCGTLFSEGKKKIFEKLLFSSCPNFTKAADGGLYCANRASQNIILCGKNLSMGMSGYPTLTSTNGQRLSCDGFDWNNGNSCQQCYKILQSALTNNN